MAESDLSERRASQNQALFQDIGDGVRALHDEIDGVILIEEFICECGAPDCSDYVALTSDEYEGLREVPTRFAVHREHVDPAFDRVVATHERYAIVARRSAGDGADQRR
jgi:hypothetical protein